MSMIVGTNLESNDFESNDFESNDFESFDFESFDLESLDIVGKNILHRVIETRNKELIKQVLNHSKINKDILEAIDNESNTVLHLAMNQNSCSWDNEIIILLLDKMKSMEISKPMYHMNLYGITPLMYSTFRNDKNLITFFLDEMKANPFETNNQGHSAFFISLICSNNKLIHKFINYKLNNNTLSLSEKINMNLNKILNYCNKDKNYENKDKNNENDDTLCEYIKEEIHNSNTLSDILSLNKINVNEDLISYHDIKSHFKKILNRPEIEKLPSNIKQEILTITFPDKITSSMTMTRFLYNMHVKINNILLKINEWTIGLERFGRSTLQLLFDRLLNYIKSIFQILITYFLEADISTMIKKNVGNTILINVFLNILHNKTSDTFDVPVINKLIKCGANPFVVDTNSHSIFCNLINSEKNIIYSNYSQILRNFIETNNRSFYQIIGQDKSDKDFYLNIIKMIDNNDINMIKLFNNNIEMSICSKATKIEMNIKHM